MQIDQIQSFYAGIIQGVGENIDREGLIKTPERAAKALAYLCRGYQQDLSNIVNDAVFRPTTTTW